MNNYNSNDDTHDEGLPEPLPNLPPVEVALQHFDRIIDPVSRRKKWTTSRIGFTGKNMEPVLDFLARLRFGDYNRTHLSPYWKDANWQNETWENVGLHIRSVGDARRVNPFGVPAGTPEYWKRYRAANKDKIKTYQKNAREKVQALKKQIEELERNKDSDIVAHLLGEHTPDESPGGGV